MQNSRVRRRRFLQYAAAAGAGWSVSAQAGDSPEGTVQVGAKPTQAAIIEEPVDVLVVGGGTAGSIAAIQAARAGAKTLLVECGSQLGGAMTVGGVCFPGLFHAWGKQVIAGIGWDLVRECVALDGGALPDFATPPTQNRHWLHQVLINPFLYALLAEEACRDAGVTICYYEFPTAVSEQDSGWQVDIVGPGIQRRVHCKQIVDCTGGADIVGLIGLPRLREEETQPGSMLFKLNTPFQAGRQRLDAVYIHGADSSNSATRTEADLTGRSEILKRLRQESGKPRLTQMQPQAAFRESYRIVGETLITHDDYTSGRKYEDAVCYAFYPVDLHTRHGVRPRQLAEGVLPTIPRRALIPKDSRNLMVAGRSVSSDRLANSGLRVQAPCMAMGQAAGAAAALAAQQQTTPSEVPLQSLVALLRRHGAIVPPDSPT